MKHIMCVHLKQWPIERTERNPQRPPPREPDRSLQRLARWMIRFSPIVAVQPPDAILLDVTGSERLFGGFDRLIHLASSSLKKFGLSHSLAIAPTVGAAWAMARNLRFAICDLRLTETQIANQKSQIANHLAPLSVASLRLNEELVMLLHTLGIDTIGQLMALPRKSLPARFGSEILTRLDQAMGHIDEPLVPVRPRQSIHAKLEFEAAIDSLQTLWEAFKHLINEVTRQLSRRGRGAKKLLLEFFPPYAAPIKKVIDLSRPSADPVAMFNLLRCAGETVSSDVGFIGLCLSVIVSEPLAEEQLGLLDQEQRQAEREFDHLLERLRLRMGDSAVLTTQLVASHIPERAFCFCDTGRISAGKPVNQRVMAHRNGFKSRPLHLLPMPVEVRCMSLPLMDNEGLPVSFTHNGRSFEIVRTSGPERIAGEWWEGRGKTRDYFDVEAAEGRRFWLFRVIETRKWYLHGIFDC